MLRRVGAVLMKSDRSVSDAMMSSGCMITASLIVHYPATLIARDPHAFSLYLLSTSLSQPF